MLLAKHTWGQRCMTTIDTRAMWLDALLADLHHDNAHFAHVYVR